jgi:hypothetical protein
VIPTAIAPVPKNDVSQMPFSNAVDGCSVALVVRGPLYVCKAQVLLDFNSETERMGGLSQQMNEETIQSAAGSKMLAWVENAVLRLVLSSLLFAQAFATPSERKQYSFIFQFLEAGGDKSEELRGPASGALVLFERLENFE